MPDRRELLHAGFVLSAGLVTEILPSHAVASARTALSLEKFVFDNRFAEAVEMAGQAARTGIALYETDGDMSQLWYDHLAPGRAAPGAFAGITTKDGLFVLETGGADHGMRVIARQESRSSPLVSWVIAPGTARHKVWGQT